jgi:hypothetical protein
MDIRYTTYTLPYRIYTRTYSTTPLTDCHTGYIHGYTASFQLPTFMSTSLSTYVLEFMLGIRFENNNRFDLTWCVTIGSFCGKIIISAHFNEYFYKFLNITWQFVILSQMVEVANTVMLDYIRLLKTIPKIVLFFLKVLRKLSKFNVYTELKESHFYS